MTAEVKCFILGEKFLGADKMVRIPVKVIPTRAIRIDEARKANPEIETLVPDFRGRMEVALDILSQSQSPSPSDQFQCYENIAKELGFKYAACGLLGRSSYREDKQAHGERVS
jgi:lipoate synthase